jgi:hypothetical protein
MAVVLQTAGAHASDLFVEFPQALTERTRTLPEVPLHSTVILAVPCPLWMTQPVGTCQV